MKKKRFSLDEIRAWRAEASAEGRPSSLKDFYTTHGICPKCRGRGQVQVTAYATEKCDCKGGLLRAEDK